MTGIEEIREAATAFSYNKEAFNMSFTAEELLLIFRAWKASKWDIFPDQWEDRQVDEALEGIVPAWEPDPIYGRPYAYYENDEPSDDPDYEGIAARKFRESQEGALK